MIINVDMIYPIGAIYISTVSTNPSNFFGGAWEQIQARYLMGAGKPSKNSYDAFGQIPDSQINNWNFGAGSTFGEYDHQLSIQEMPSHNHQVKRGTDGNSWFGITGKEPNGDLPYAVDTTSAGGNAAHNNLPPTLVVYMWKRIA